jgi:hypothetical protein
MTQHAVYLRCTQHRGAIHLLMRLFPNGFGSRPWRFANSIKLETNAPRSPPPSEPRPAKASDRQLVPSTCRPATATSETTSFWNAKPQFPSTLFSADGGKSWRNTLSRDQHVYDVTIDPRDRRTLYAAGFESSAWRSTDRGVTWRRIRGFSFKRGHRVIPDPADPSKIYITTFGSSVWHGPAAGEKDAADPIKTALPMPTP